MSDEDKWDPFVNFQGLHENQAEWLNNMIREGKVDNETLIDMATADRTDVTSQWHTALFALGHDEMVEWFHQVHACVGNRTLGFAIMVDSEKHPEVLDDECKEITLRVMAAVLKSGGMHVQIVGRTLRCHGPGCPGGVNCTFPFDPNTVTVDPFGSTVQAFVEEVDKTLGPSYDPPNNEGWGKWL